MGRKPKEEPFDFEKEYKGLPVKKRVGLIKIARNILKLQKESADTLADAPNPKKEKRKNDTSDMIMK